jgi:hypothetical protein
MICIIHLVIYVCIYSLAFFLHAYMTYLSSNGAAKVLVLDISGETNAFDGVE